MSDKKGHYAAPRMRCFASESLAKTLGDSDKNQHPQKNYKDQAASVERFFADHPDFLQNRQRACRQSNQYYPDGAECDYAVLGFQCPEPMKKSGYHELLLFSFLLLYPNQYKKQY